MLFLNRGEHKPSPISNGVEPMSETVGQLHQNTATFESFPSLDLSFDLTKEYLKIQQEQMQALDNKASVVLGAGTALVSTGLILQAAILSSSLRKPITLYQIIPLFTLVLVYLLVVLAALLAYRVSTYRWSPHPEQLYKNFLMQPEVETKSSVFRSLVEDTKRNKEVISKKVFWVQAAFVALGCETVILVLFLLFQITD